jgi:hypothetical protein
MLLPDLLNSKLDAFIPLLPFEYGLQDQFPRLIISIKFLEVIWTSLASVIAEILPAIAYLSLSFMSLAISSN